jgi:osmotically inducible protein OsmC
MKKQATAIWNGNGKEGKGFLSTENGLLNKAQYSFGSRFENASGTSPEELLAVAHSSCFSMKLAFNLQEAGFNPIEIKTVCTVTISEGTVTESHLDLEVKVNGIEESKFEELVIHAKDNCPISKALAVNKTLDFKLIN